MLFRPLYAYLGHKCFMIPPFGSLNPRSRNRTTLEVCKLHYSSCLSICNLKGKDRSQTQVLSEDALDRVGKPVPRIRELAVLLILGDPSAQPPHVVRHNLGYYLEGRRYLKFSLSLSYIQ